MQQFFALTEDSTAFRELEKQLARKFSKYQEARRLDRGLISASSWDRISAVFQSSFSIVLPNACAAAIHNFGRRRWMFAPLIGAPKFLR